MKNIITNRVKIITIIEYRFYISNLLPNIKNQYYVKYLSSFKEVQNIVSKESFDIILLDLQYDNIINIINFVNELKNRNYCNNFIIISDPKLKDDDKKLLYTNGITYILFKPISFKKLDVFIEIISLKNNHELKKLINNDLLDLLEIISIENKKIVIEIISKKKIGEIYIDQSILRKCDFLEYHGYRAFLEVLKFGNYKYNFTSYKSVDENLNNDLHETILKVLNDIFKNNLLINNNLNNNKGGLSMNVEKLKKAIEVQRESLGDGLLATDIYLSADGMSIADYNGNPKACALFSQITQWLRNALDGSGFPILNKYYILDLVNDMMVVVIFLGDYQWGMLLDKKRVQMGLLLNIIIPKMVSAFEEAIA